MNKTLLLILCDFLLLTLLALLYAADCGMPCLDGCGTDARELPSAVVMGGDHGDHDRGSLPAEAHCDCHCLCACHLPLLSFPASEAVPPSGEGIRGGLYQPSLLAAPANPPDHIPLV